MIANSVCVVRLPDGRYRCARTGLVFSGRFLPIRCCPDLAVIDSQSHCHHGPILHAAPPTADPAAYVSRLDRCRSANCGLLHLVDSRMVCVGRGRSCEWLGEWARFLASGEECPNWPAKSPAGHQ